MEGTEGKNGFWKNIMLPAIGTGVVSTLSNIAIMEHQNKFNSREAAAARGWNLQMDNTKYQRTVADMKAAGVNPALAMDGGVTTQATSNATAQGASPAYSNLSAIASMAQAISAARLNDAQARNINTDTKLKENQGNYYYELGKKTFQEALGVEIDNQFREESNQLKIQGQKLANSMTEERIKEINENINKLKSETDLAIKQAKTEEEKVKLMITQEALNKAHADQIQKLLPYQQALMSAQTQEAKARAGLMMVQAAYQQGLIDNGMIDATIKKMYADANEADARAIYTMTKHRLNGEQAEIDKMASETSLNNVKKVTTIINTIVEGLGTIAQGALSVGKAGAVMNLW